MKKAVTAYQEHLRALGKWLDQRPVASFTAVETPDGFTVTYEVRETGQETAERPVQRDSERHEDIASPSGSFGVLGAKFTRAEGGNPARRAKAPDGFKLVTETLTFSELVIRERGASRTHRRGSDLGVVAREPGGYQNLLRSLGLWLEESSAHSLVVRDIGEELLVTYQVIDPAAGYVGVKYMVVLNAEERQALRDDARRRRSGRWWQVWA